MIESNIYLEMILHTNLDLTSKRQKTARKRTSPPFFTPPKSLDQSKCQIAGTLKA